MSQINFRLTADEDEIITYIANQKKISKTLVVRELFEDALGEKILPSLLDEYKAGKIGLKKVIQLSHLSPREIMHKISELQIDPPISPEVDDYSSKVRDLFLQDIKTGRIPIKNSRKLL